jgi:peptide/nickel transport system substrate-binding protein
MYGTLIVSRQQQNSNYWDPYAGTTGTGGFPGFQSLFQPDYTVDPAIWDNESQRYSPPEFIRGLLAASYEMPNPYTVVVKLRQDVYWWNVAPANGRQFTSADVVYHWNRCLGFNGGTPSPWFAKQAGYAPLLSVVANDKFTVTFNWKQGTNPYTTLIQMQSTNMDRCYELPESVALWGNLDDWHHCVGTGPYQCTDFVTDSSVTLTAVPNYYEFDARFPQNRLPYVKTRKVLIIASNITAEAAMRVGKIDAYPAMPTQDALNMQKTNPSIVTKNGYPNNELTLDCRDDLAPFSDIRVRTAMQHAIDIATIAHTLFQDYAVPYPAGIASNQLVAYPWYPYPAWTQEEKDSYAYNPTLAKQMLADAGFPNGFTCDCILESDVNMDLHLIAQSELAAVGIKENFTLMDSGAWQAYCITNLKYQALCARNTGSMGEMVNPNTVFLLCTAGFSFNWIRMTDPKMEAWYTQGMNSQSIDDMYKVLYDEVRFVVPKHYAISLAEPMIFNMVQPWVGGNPGVGVLGPVTNVAWVNDDMKKSMGY